MAAADHPETPSTGQRRPAAARPRRRGGKAPRQAVIARLWRTAERQVADIETRLRVAGGDPATLERDAKTLAVLARTVRDLVALDAEAKATETTDKPDDQDEPPRDLDAFRRELAEKLAQLGALEAGD